MKTLTKTVFALTLVASAPAFADENGNQAQAFDRAAVQQPVPGFNGAYTAMRGQTTVNTDRALDRELMNAYRADSGR